MFRFACILILCAVLTNCTLNHYQGNAAFVHGIPVSNLKNYGNYPTSVKKLVSKSMTLSQKKLSYIFGSADPDNGGMDCSGTIQYLLKTENHVTAPRRAEEMYSWVRKYGKLHKVSSRQFSSTQFNNLKPGDLLFWTGTYRTRHKNSISHVMMYLGKNKDNKPLMFGANNSERPGDHGMHGVGVYEFYLPSRFQRARFVGYGCIPSVTCKQS